MIGRGVRIRHEDRRRPRSRQLVDRSAGAREREVGGRERSAEVVRERQQPVAVSPHAAAERLEVALAGEMEDERPFVRERVDDDLVERSRTLAPAVDHEQRPLERKLESATCLVTRNRPRARGHRTPCHAVLRARPVRDREGEEHATRERQRQPVGQAQVRIGLHDRSGDSARCGREHHRPGHVAASAENDMRPPPREDRPARERRLAREQTSDRARSALGSPRKARDLERVELVAGLGYELRFSPSRRPGERHERAAGAQRLGYRERRQHVAAGSPGCDQAPWRVGLGHQHLRC